MDALLFFVLLCKLCQLVVGKVLLERLGKLVGAGCLLWTAFDTLQARNCIVDIHAFYKCADAFEIAVATAKEAYVANFAVNNIECDFARAGASGCVFHSKVPR